jgi:hypothetical protein
MTIQDGTGLTCVYDLTPFAFEEEVHGKRAFRGLASASGALWAYGDGVFLLSLNGVQWTDLAGELDLPGSFSVSAVVGDENGAFVFARSRDGLLCYHLARGTWNCTRLPSLPTGSPGALAERIDGALLACVNEGRCTQFMQLRDSEGVWEQLPVSLTGTAVHFEMSDSGVGLCALWGIERERGLARPAPSAVYRTQDCGISWTHLQKMDTMLLGGASGHGGATLLGGTDGYIAEGTVEGFRDCYQRTAEEVAALSSERSQQAAVLASLEERPSQALLWRASSPEWKRFDVGLIERIVGIRFVRFGVVLLCTRQSLFTYGIELVQ